MASDSGAASTDPEIDLATLVSKGTVGEEVLQLYAEKGLLDIPDKDGRTPLMIACLKGLEDTVKFLLANGANPNSKCIKEGNTPMHYACIVDEPDEEYALSGRFYKPSKWAKLKLPVITHLLRSGALILPENLNGWTPPCFAALYMLGGNILNKMFLDAKVPKVETMIKVTEILGVTAVTFYPDNAFEAGLDCLWQAIGYRQNVTLPEAQMETSELGACFSKVSLLECHSAEEIESKSDVGVQAHAFLVGDRLFSKELKQKYLYPSLVTFGSELMWDQDKLEEGRQVFSYAIVLERLGELKLGSVVEKLAEICRYWYKDNKPSDQYLQYVHDLLCEYKSVLNHVHLDSLSDRSDFLMASFSDILYDEAVYCSTIDILQSKLQAIEKLVRIIRGRIREENPDKYLELSSVTYKIMESFNQQFDYKFSIRSLLRVKFVMRKTLFFDNASYWDREDRFTLLHMLADCMYNLGHLEHLEHLEDLARAFVRHGCPIDVMNTDGDTARDILISERDALIGRGLYDRERYPRLLASVSPPTTVLTLEEIAIRQILQKDISYVGEVPTCLYGMIKGGLKDSDLEWANAEMGNNEEME